MARHSRYDSAVNHLIAGHTLQLQSSNINIHSLRSQFSREIKRLRAHGFNITKVLEITEGEDGNYIAKVITPEKIEFTIANGSEESG